MSHTTDSRDINEILKSKTASTKDSPYYQKDIGSRLKPDVEKAYLKWSGLRKDKFREKLYEVRDKGWAVAPYPCVGQWYFILPNITAFPQYPSIVALAIKPTSKILDLGCCFGQDLRLLAVDGVPTENMYASDLVSECWNLGYELFSDRSKMHAKFVQGDIFDAGSKLTSLNGLMNIIMVNQFLHLWDWEKQMKAIKRMIGFSSGKGALVVGHQRGREKSLEKVMSWGKMFVHDLKTFREIWNQAGGETRTKWNVDAWLIEPTEFGLEKEDTTWTDQDSMWINFVIERIE